MNNESAKVIVSLIGVAGLILYGYLIFMSDISADYQKYTVLAASLGILYPLGALLDNEYFSGNGYKVFGIGLLGTCVILFAGYASKIDTEDGLIWDFFKAITTEGYRYFYFFLLLVANIFPFVSRKYSIWLSAFTIGIMIPVIIASLLMLALIIAGLSLLGTYGKSNKGTSSWSSIFSSPSSTSNNTVPQKSEAPKRTKGIDNRRYAILDIEYARDEYAAKNAVGFYHAREALPADFTYNQISRYLKKKYMLGYDPVIVNTKIKNYTSKDSVDPNAYKI